MAEKKTKAKGKAAPRKSHPRKVPLILQTREVEREDGSKVEVTVGQLIAMTVRAGAFRAEAARIAGISRTVIFNWTNRGEDALAIAMEQVAEAEDLKAEDVPEADRPYVDFVNALEEAEAQAEVWHVRNLKEHAKKDPKVSQWFLARRWPERWGAREHPDSSGGWTLADLERLVDEADQIEG